MNGRGLVYALDWVIQLKSCKRIVRILNLLINQIAHLISIFGLLLVFVKLGDIRFAVHFL
jgi:hypothetical protein